MDARVRRRPSFRQILSWSHRWLGLASGLVVLVVSLTGALYAFEHEITAAVRADLMRVDPRSGERLPASRLLESARHVLGPERPVSSVRIPSDPAGAWTFRSRETDETAVTYFGWLVRDLEVVVDPWTGAVKGSIDNRLDFFHLVKFLHWSLLLRTEYGQPVVGAAVAVFVVLLLSGLWLWRPRTWAQARAKLVPRLAGPWRNRLWSWHATFGAWVFPVALVIAVTGLVWAFRVVMFAVYALAALSVTPPDLSRAESSRSAVAGAVLPLDRIVAGVQARHPQATSLWLWLPAADTGREPVGAYVRYDEGVYWNSVQESWDRNDAVLLKSKAFADGNRGERLVAMNYDIHVGAVLGLPGKILAFLASLVCASLPVTGFLMWRKRRH